MIRMKTTLRVQNMTRMKNMLRVQNMIKTQRVKSRVISLFGENIMTGLITGNVSSKTGKLKSAYAMSRAGRILIIGYEGEYRDERA